MPRAALGWKRWTAEEDALLDSYPSMSFPEIARQLGRTTPAVKGRYHVRQQRKQELQEQGKSSNGNHPPAPMLDFEMINAELIAMQTAAEVLQRLDADCRARVVRWLADRFVT